MNTFRRLLTRLPTTRSIIPSRSTTIHSHSVRSFQSTTPYSASHSEPLLDFFNNHPNNNNTNNNPLNNAANHHLNNNTNFEQEGSYTIDSTATPLESENNNNSHLEDKNIFTPDTPMQQAQDYFNEALKYWNIDDEVMAMEFFQKSIRAHPTADAYFNIGNLYWQMGKINDAITYWNKSLKLNPNIADCHINLANAYYLKTPREEQMALLHYEHAASLSPEDGELHFNYGCLLDAAGEFEKAAQEFLLAHKNGIEKAQAYRRNVMAKLMGRSKGE